MKKSASVSTIPTSIRNMKPVVTGSPLSARKRTGSSSTLKSSQSLKSVVSKVRKFHNPNTYNIKGEQKVKPPEVESMDVTNRVYKEEIIIPKMWSDSAIKED
jgi:hypothetical protein